MEELQETAVSLDELTLDITSDVLDESTQAKIQDFDGIKVTSSENQYETNGNQIDTPSVNADMLNTKSVEDNDDVGSEDDFEADVPPLLLFPKREEDDEDFDFDFPEVNSSLPGKDNSSTENSCKTVHFSSTTSETTEEKIQIENLDPEILTARDKVISELTNITLPTTPPEDQIGHDEGSSGKDNLPDEFLNDEDKKESPVEEDSGTERSRPSIVTTAEDWEQVQVVVPGFADQKTQKSGAASVIETKPLAKFSDSWSEMSSLNYDHVKGNIKTSTDRRGLSAFTHFLFGPPKLQKDLIPERDLVFCLAATPFDNSSEVHNRVLQTIYRCLTGSKFDCQRYGSHWEEIGFQGQDPSTDLRGAGILSLLHLLFFLQDPSTKALARDIYKLSLHPTQNFPFCVMSINITVQCLRVIRDDVYNREFNKRKNVVGTFNCLYAALFLRLYQLWKKGKTIHDSGYILEDVANYSRKNSKTIFKDLESYEKSGADQNLFGDHPSEARFFNVCKEDKCDDKINAELY